MAPDGVKVLLLDSESDSETDSEEERLIATLKARGQSSRARICPSTTPSADNSHTAAQKEALKRPQSPLSKAEIAAAARTKRQLVAEAKVAEKEAARAARAAACFTAHQRAGGDSRSEIEIVVSPSLFNKCTKKEILRQVRPVYEGYVKQHAVGIANLIFWRRLFVDGVALAAEDASDAGYSLLWFQAEDYMNHVEHQTLESLATYIRSKRPNTKVTFVTWGLQAEYRRRAVAIARRQEERHLINMRAVQDSSTMLYMEYGICVHQCANDAEVANYLLLLTDTIANAPYHQKSTLLESCLQYRDSRRIIGHRTTVIATRPAPESQLPGDEDDEYGMEGYGDNNANNGDVHVATDLGAAGSETVTFARAEGSGELGFMYLAVLTQIPTISLPKAKAIRERYSTLFHLLKAYKNCASEEEKKMLLADAPVRYSGGTRRLGPHSSKRVASVFTSTDPNTVIHE